MPSSRDPVRQHLQAALAAYGGDLLLPVAPLPAGPPRAARPARPPAPATAGAPSPTRPPAARPATRPVPAPAQEGRRSPEPGSSRQGPAPPPTRTPRAPEPGIQRPPRADATPSTSPSTSPPAIPAANPAADPAGADFQALRTEVLACRACKLCEQRRTVVFGEGNPDPDVMFVGEAPGAVEDRTGRPFVGPAGQLLDRIIENAMGLQRRDVFIANVNKCRPPGNREPEPDEVAACLPYLRRQVELLRPKVLIALGRVAAHNLLGTREPMRALRGRELSYAGIPVVVTWHPAYLLREPSRKAETWEDIKRVNRMLGRPEVPPIQG